MMHFSEVVFTRLELADPRSPSAREPPVGSRVFGGVAEAPSKRRRSGRWSKSRLTQWSCAAPMGRDGGERSDHMPFLADILLGFLFIWTLRVVMCVLSCHFGSSSHLQHRTVACSAPESPDNLFAPRPPLSSADRVRGDRHCPTCHLRSGLPRCRRLHRCSLTFRLAQDVAPRSGSLQPPAGFARPGGSKDTCSTRERWT